MDPATLKFAESHEWTHVDGPTATIGISDFAVELLTDLVYIELPTVGAKLDAGSAFGEVESVKAVSDLYAPVSGEVIAVNEALVDDLAVLADDPFGEGWIVKIRMADPSQLESLLDRAAYETHCAAEEH